MISRIEMVGRLERLSNRHCVAFAARIAGLALPALAKERSEKEEFLWFFKKDPAGQLSSVLRGIYSAYSFAFLSTREIAAAFAAAASAAAQARCCRRLRLFLRIFLLRRRFRPRRHCRCRLRRRLCRCLRRLRLLPRPPLHCLLLRCLRCRLCRLRCPL